MSDLEDQFLAMWRILSTDCDDPVREYRFDPNRRWRFDFAWPDARVGVEIEGGVWSRGRHTRGSGYQADCDKYNAATLLGWRVLRYTASHVCNDPHAVIEQVRSLIASQRMLINRPDVE